MTTGVESEENGLVDSRRNTFQKMDIENQQTPKERDQWARGLEFLLSCISLSVGLGNLWRFPYTCYKNGGAAFLLPYLIVLFLIGKPFYLLEMFLGQFNSKGAVKAVQIFPIMKGIGWGQQFISAIISTYYTSLIGLTLAYFLNSFTVPELPWATCYNLPSPCYSASFIGNPFNESGVKSSAELFFRNITSQKADISDGIGQLNPYLTMCLFISWICVYFSIVKGIKTSGKLSYIFAITPYVVLISILIFVCNLPGAFDGIKYLFEPKFEKLWDLHVWYEACTQCFYSLTIGMGCILMFSSYNKFDHNIYRDAAIISLTDTFTSILGGTAIFAVLGNLAHNTNETNFAKLTDNHIGVSFISYPEAIAKIAASISNKYYFAQIMAVIFFGMLFILGVGSTVGLLSNVSTNIKDAFPKLKYWFIAGVGSLLGFLVGLVYVTEGGMAILGLIDHFEGNLLVFTLATLELVGCVWLYGFQELCWDIEYTLGRKLSSYWRICWGVIMPAFLITINLHMLFTFKNPTYGNNLQYPNVALIFGYGLLTFGFSQILFAMCFDYFGIFQDKGIKKFFSYLFTINEHWGPAKEENKTKWREFKENKRSLRDLEIHRHDLSWIQQKQWELLGKFE
ncbi:sodium-dependent nutrient amino acid transporter 1-like [Chironomus tepperi]|uniref:sodium-dependent nutrient amino acid transporter 1-like n=1 Tax=Chironomus tepperi TaxID=113505 RepID=UPI00391FAB7F